MRKGEFCFVTGPYLALRCFAHLTGPPGHIAKVAHGSPRGA